MSRLAHLLPNRVTGFSIRGKARTFWHVPRAMKGLMLRLPWMIGAARLGLRFFSFQKVLRFVEQRSQHSASPALTPEQIAWAVNRVGQRLLTERPCLPLALVALLLLRRRGYPATLRLGVVRDDEGKLVAHAWVESDGKVLVGELDDLATYAPFPNMESVV